MTSLDESKQPDSPFGDRTEDMENRPQTENDNVNRPPPYTTGEAANEDTEKKPVDLPIRGGRGRGCGRGAGRGGAGPRGGMRGAGCGPRGRGRGLGHGRGCGMGHRHAHGHPGHMGHHHRKGNHGAGFGLPAFLGNLGSRFGLNLNGPATSDNDAEKNPNGFVPRTDIFDMPARYMVHISLPGAKKQNIKVDYLPVTSTLHVSGTINRPPGIQQKQMDGLVVDGRGREIGPFEKEVHLGTHLKPANIAIKRISSKLVDGVLIVLLPKKVADPSLLRKRISIEEPKEGEKGDKKDKVNDEKTGGEKVLYEYNEKVAADDDSETEAEKANEKEDELLLQDDYERSDPDEKEYVTVDVK